MISADLPSCHFMYMGAYRPVDKTQMYMNDIRVNFIKFTSSKSTNVLDRKTSNHKNGQVKDKISHWFPSGTRPPGLHLRRGSPLTVLYFPCTIILLGNECSAQSFGDWITLWSYTCTLPKCRKTATFSLVVFQWSNCYHLFAFELASDQIPRTK